MNIFEGMNQFTYNESINHHTFIMSVMKDKRLHPCSEILDIDIEECMKHPVLTQYCKIISTAPTESPAIDVPVYYINTEDSKDRRKHMEDQFFQSGIPNHRIHRIRAEIFPEGVDKHTRVTILKNNHVRAWKQALSDKSSDLESPGVVIMEDDVCLLSGWRVILKTLVFGDQQIATRSTEADHTAAKIIRFDVLPQYESNRSDVPRNGFVFAFPCVSKYCNGAYFMTWSALKLVLKEQLNDHNNNEDIVHAVGLSLTGHNYVQCIPPLAIQTWFIHRDKEEDGLISDTSSKQHKCASKIQSLRHMRRLRTCLCESLLPENGHKYIISETLRKSLKEVNQLFYRPRSEVTYPVHLYTVTPNFIIGKFVCKNETHVHDDRPLYKRISRDQRNSVRASTLPRSSITYVHL